MTRTDSLRRRLLVEGPPTLLGALALRRSFASEGGSPKDTAGGKHTARGAHTARGRFAFVLIGDVPYFRLEELMLEQMFEAFDDGLAFVIHIGDLKAGWERCDDALLEARAALLERSPVPLVYVPGDNEWSDCSRPRAGGFDPRERLDWLRRRFFSKPAAIGGRPDRDGLAFERQADARPGGLVENLRWRRDGVRFVTLNLPGGNNGLRAAGLGVEDWRARERLNAEWLRGGYALAARERDAAVVVAAHANPRFDRRRQDGYADFRALLVELSEGFPGPTLFLHGDTHRHGVEQLTPKLLRVESFGSPFANLWVRIDVDANADRPFRISRQWIDRASPPP